MPLLHIGVDLDNTIIDYDGVFGPVAEEMGLLERGAARGSKEEVKTQLIHLDPSENLWMRLQGQVYGRRIGRARLYRGVADCLALVRTRGVRISIVSHKTRHGHFDPFAVDLWEAARGWLTDQGFFDPNRLALSPGDVHFEETREAKITRIGAIGCDLFIDDLPEVLLHPRFPSSVEGIWFAGDRAVPGGNGLFAYRGWRDILDNLAGRL
jgi:hypothetical protein